MPWTGHPETDSSDAVRSLVGDKDPANPLLEDNEYTAFLAAQGGNVERAAGMAAKALAGKYAKMVDSAVDTTRESLSQIAKSYRDLGDSLSGGAGGGQDQSGVIRGMPMAGGIVDPTTGDAIPNFFTRDYP